MSFRIRRRKAHSTWDRIPVRITLADVMAYLELGSMGR